MWRTLIAATLVYGSGHPSLDGYRPAFLDRPLQSFHEDINSTARDGKKALASLDESRGMRYLKDYIERIEAQLRSGSARRGTDD
jgi:hypothetical protein